MAKSGLVSWNGDRLKAKAIEAAKRGINVTMSRAVIHFKGNHPGWINQTGQAEGSVDITQFAEEQGKRVIGQWGSRNVAYMLSLEFLRGAALRNAADVTYPQLPGNIQEAYDALPEIR